MNWLYLPLEETASQVGNEKVTKIPGSAAIRMLVSVGHKQVEDSEKIERRVKSIRKLQRSQQEKESRRKNGVQGVERCTWSVIAPTRWRGHVNT